MTEETDSRRRDWFAVSRATFDHPILSGGEYDRRSAWLWLIANAAWSDHEVRTRGGVITLRRGEVLIGRQHLAEVWGWSEKRVRNFMAELRREGMLEMSHRDGQYASVAKISNYERFQRVQADGGPAKGPTKGQRGANEGPHITKGTRETRVEGPTPTASRGVDRAILDGALADYNRAAEVIGFARCTTLTEQRAKVLAKRLADIGGGDLTRGAERFRDSLAAIPHDRFLAGKAPPRDGTKPFRLDLDRLLSTASGMGDVLGKLLDLHDEHGPAAVGRAVPPRREADSLNLWREAQAEELAAQRTRYDGGGHVH